MEKIVNSQTSIYRSNMIHFLYQPRKFYHTPRTYLNQWFHDDIVVVTDVDINEEKRNLETLIKAHHCPNVVVDLSHNQMFWHELPDFLLSKTILSCRWQDWYEPELPNIHYFPLWLWMFSLRNNAFFDPCSFDASGKKTQSMMCLNRNPHPHRVKFAELLKSIVDDIVFTFGTRLLDGEELDHSNMGKIDISVGHPVYSQCAVNIVTETCVDRPSVSEKSCKPFVARQIPVLVGSPGISQFYADLGLDMFDDLVPWRQWDSISDTDQRLALIADFVLEWHRSGRVVEQYHARKARIERNKQYFHSEAFRAHALRHMPAVDAY